MNTAADVWLTHDAYGRLQEELAELLAQDGGPVSDEADHVLDRFAVEGRVSVRFRS
jgi:hypothetical protein